MTPSFAAPRCPSPTIPITAPDTWTYGRAAPLDNINLTVLMLDGVQAGGHCRVVAVGIDTTGAKYPLGLWESSRDLVERRRTDQ